MSERERLIELLQEFTDNNNGGGSNYGRADHLLDNGVIVPPCKVGDVLYLPIPHRVIAYEVSTIKYDGDLLRIVTHNKLSGTQRTIWSQDVGATIFLTKEEAERELERVKEEWLPGTPEYPRECDDCGWRCGKCKTALADVVGGYWDDALKKPELHYCPNCGVKMKGK